ncbi:lysozyme family protein [Thomasclavelia sp.]
MSEKIKTRKTDKSIHVLNKEKNLEYYKKTNDIHSKDKIESPKEEGAYNPRNYAVNKIVRREKITAVETVSKGKSLYKKKIKNKKRKDKFNESVIKTKDKLKQQEQSVPIVKEKSSIQKLNMKTKKVKPTPVKSELMYNSKMKSFHIYKHKKKIIEAKQSSSNIKKGAVSTGKAVKGTFHFIKKAVTSVKTLISVGSSFILLIVILLFIGIFGALSGGSGTNSATESLSQEVVEYREIIEKYAKQYEIGDYVSLIQAVMMQESGGKGEDPMQSSECIYNERYPEQHNGITNVEYSIDCGVHYLADCIKKSKVTGPSDMNNISLALQGYNFGDAYINWAVEHFGGYSRANAIVFSDQRKIELNTDVYGDPDYVSHVLRYYHLGSGNIVLIAKSQVGNVGGKPYWSWYGFESRVEWCACFVSWCANESGDLNINVPKFSKVEDGIKWYKDKGKWRDKNYTPQSGDLIFFDWQNDNDPDHVGIVERVEDNLIYTIEGNSKDECKEKSYSLFKDIVFGYGLLS